MDVEMGRNRAFRPISTSIAKAIHFAIRFNMKNGNGGAADDNYNDNGDNGDEY